MTTRSLKLAKNLSLPVDAVTQTIAILAKRRAGKSYTMRRLAEQLFEAGQQIVLVDPKGDQWGIRSAADGKAPGLPITILGGERGDVPLEASAGEVVAKLVVEERVSVVLDLSLFRKHEVATFTTAFLENLYRLKAREQYRTPMMLVMDEADAIAPQKPQKGEERMLGAAEDIVRRGGQRGIGCVLVTQRSAVLNKNVLTQAQMLIALRTIAPQDLAAMNAWIDVHGTEEQKRTLMDSLPSLPVGDAWFWSPGWPDVDGIFQRVHVLPIETFDSGATPKAGEKRIEPKAPADVDLEALKRQMAATIEKAKADDPRELRRQIAELRKEIASAEKPTNKISAAPTQKPIEKFVLKDGQLARAEKLVERIDQLADKYSTFEEDLRVTAKEIRDALAKTRAPLPHTPRSAPSTPLHPQGRREPASRAVSGVTAARPARGNPDGSLAGGERKILTALAQHPDGRSKTQVAILTAYAHNGGGFNNYVGALRSKGFIAGTGDRLHITDAGLAALGSYDPLPTGRDLLDYWLRQLGKAERAILEQLAAEYPATLTKDALGERTGYEPNGGGFNNALSRLRSLELIEGRGDLRASQDLFS